MLNFFRKSNLVGVDIGSSSVKIIRLKESAGGFSLLNFDVAILHRETVVDGTIMNFTLLVDKIKELVRVNNLKNRDCVLAVSGNSVIIKKISLPEMSNEELEDSIQWEAEQYIPFDIKDVNVDFQILNPRVGHGQMDVLLVAAKKDIINDYVSVAIEAGLNPVVVDVATFCVQNMFEVNYGFPTGEAIAIINVGASHTNINVIANGITSFTRDISIGGSALTEEIQKQLNVTWEEAEQFKISHEGSVSSSTITREITRISERVSDMITTEIQRTLDFYLATSMQSELRRIYLCGGSSQVPSLIRALERRLEVPVELVNPFKNIFIDERKFDLDLLQKMAPIASVAIGLGLRKANDKR